MHEARSRVLQRKIADLEEQLLRKSKENVRLDEQVREQATEFD
jgi:cell division protein FtsL